MTDLINDILFGAVLQPVLDLVGNPDATANTLIGLAFDPSPSKKFLPGSGQKVELLEQFVKTHQTSQKSVSIIGAFYLSVPMSHTYYDCSAHFT